jgi:two-component system response regulator PilR (NtrC family)
MNKSKLLIIDDDRIFCSMLRRYFEQDYEVAAFSDPEEAALYLRKNYADVILTDLSMPKMDGIEVLKFVKSEGFDTDVVIMTAYARVDSAIEAMKSGAYDYIIKPFTPEELALQLKNLFEKRALRDENLSLRKFIETKNRPENIIGESEKMKEVYRFIDLVSRSDATVLVTGESGTGKELVARGIHFSSRRKGKRFVSINCSAIPETLLESELFGYTKGSFSGAAADKKGLFEYADGGTIFLDEIADTPLSIQAKLLRVLQESKIRAIGGSKEVAVDTRVVCATNRDLKKMIQDNRFREDLYYRINVVSVHLPPLRDRENDIALLINHFLDGRKKVHPRVIGLLSHHAWPGNVRELRNVIERLVMLTDSDTITPDDLSDEITGFHYQLEENLSYNDAKKKLVDEFNRAVIAKTLTKYDGNVTKAAEELKLDRANFQRLMRKYGITARDYREKDGES